MPLAGQLDDGLASPCRSTPNHHRGRRGRARRTGRI